MKNIFIFPDPTSEQCASQAFYTTLLPSTNSSPSGTQISCYLHIVHTKHEHELHVKWTTESTKSDASRPKIP